MLDALTKVFSEGNGSLSSMRILVGFVIAVVTLTWSVTCIKQGVLIGFDWQEVGLITGLLGVKAYQKGKEEE